MPPKGARARPAARLAGRRRPAAAVEVAAPPEDLRGVSGGFTWPSTGLAIFKGLLLGPADDMGWQGDQLGIRRRRALPEDEGRRDPKRAAAQVPFRGALPSCRYICACNLALHYSGEMGWRTWSRWRIPHAPWRACRTWYRWSL